jgi:phage gp37-like protein
MSVETVFPIVFAVCIAWFGATYLFMLNKIQKHYGKKSNLTLMVIINNLPKPYKMFLGINSNEKSKNTKSKIVVISNILSVAITCVLFVSLLVTGIMKDIS